MAWLDKISFTVLIVMALALGMAPFSGQSHLIEKLQLLQAGQLTKGIDIFDLFMHGAPIILLLLKTIRVYQIKFKT